MEPVRAFSCAPPDNDALGRASVPLGHVAVHAVAERAHPDKVRVRVEDDDAKRCLQEQLFEHSAERVALTRPRLAAEERVPVESTRVEQETDARPGRELADAEPSPLRPRRFEPCTDAFLVRALDAHVVEGSDPVLEHPTPLDRVSLAGHELDGVDLTEALANGRVAARLELERVHSSLEAEGPAVDRGRSRHEPILAHLRLPREPARIASGTLEGGGRGDRLRKVGDEHRDEERDADRAGLEDRQAEDERLRNAVEMIRLARARRESESVGQPLRGMTRPLPQADLVQGSRAAAPLVEAGTNLLQRCAFTLGTVAAAEGDVGPDRPLICPDEEKVGLLDSLSARFEVVRHTGLIPAPLEITPKRAHVEQPSEDRTT